MSTSWFLSLGDETVLVNYVTDPNDGNKCRFTSTDLNWEMYYAAGSDAWLVINYDTETVWSLHADAFECTASNVFVPLEEGDAAVTADPLYSCVVGECCGDDADDNVDATVEIDGRTYIGTLELEPVDGTWIGPLTWTEGQETRTVDATLACTAGSWSMTVDATAAGGDLVVVPLVREGDDLTGVLDGVDVNVDHPCPAPPCCTGETTAELPATVTIGDTTCTGNLSQAGTIWTGTLSCGGGRRREEL